MDKKAKLALVKATNSIRKKFRQLHDRETGQYMLNEIKYKPITDKLSGLVPKTHAAENDKSPLICEDSSEQSTEYYSSQPSSQLDDDGGAHMIEHVGAFEKRLKESLGGADEKALIRPKIRPSEVLLSAGVRQLKDEPQPGPSRERKDLLPPRNIRTNSSSSDISDGSMLTAREDPTSYEEASASRTGKRRLEDTILVPAPKKPLKARFSRAIRSSGAFKSRKSPSGTPLFSPHHGKNLYSTRNNKPNLLMISEPIATLRKKRDEAAKTVRNLSQQVIEPSKSSPPTHTVMRKLRPRAKTISEDLAVKVLPRTRAMSTHEEAGGSGLMEYRNVGKEYVYWDDPNELVERLKLLMASQNAGHTGHLNEINSIIEEMWERRIIY